MLVRGTGLQRSVTGLETGHIMISGRNMVALQKYKVTTISSCLDHHLGWESVSPAAEGVGESAQRKSNHFFRRF